MVGLEFFSSTKIYQVSKIKKKHQRFKTTSGPDEKNTKKNFKREFFLFFTREKYFPEFVELLKNSRKKRQI